MFRIAIIKNLTALQASIISQNADQRHSRATSLEVMNGYWVKVQRTGTLYHRRFGIKLWGQCSGAAPPTQQLTFSS